jgi:hypothetical protein
MAISQYLFTELIYWGGFSPVNPGAGCSATWIRAIVSQIFPLESVAPPHSRRLPELFLFS